MRIYANECFDLYVVQRLREFQHDVMTSQEAGRQRAEDPEVLRFAIEDQRAVLTFNRRDFGRLHLASSDHFGIISCSTDVGNPEGLAQRIHQAIQTDIKGKLVRITRPAK